MMETETREINRFAALALAISEDFERDLTAASGPGALAACEARQRRLRTAFDVSEREIVEVCEARNDEEETVVQEAELALACAVLEDAARRTTTCDDYTAALWELSDVHGLTAEDLLEAEEELGWWSPWRVEDDELAHDCAIVIEARRRAVLRPEDGDEQFALEAVAAEQGLTFEEPVLERLVAAERMTGLAVWRCRWCHRLTAPDDRPRGGLPHVEGVGTERRIWRVACRACSGTAWCVAGCHDWEAAAFDPVPESCPDHD